jgi:hypothetical protein
MLSQLLHTASDSLEIPKNNKGITKDLLIAALVTDETRAYELLGMSRDTFGKFKRKWLPDFPPRARSVTRYLLYSIGYQQCLVCKELKPCSEFSKKSLDRIYVLDTYCRKCKSDIPINTVNKKQHYLVNKDKYAEARIRYFTRKDKAKPLWASDAAIKKIYDSCPEDWHVDHVYPLQSDWVCGLHVETNLQVLPKKDNLSKGNRYIESIHG